MTKQEKNKHLDNLLEWFGSLYDNDYINWGQYRSFTDSVLQKKYPIEDSIIL